MPIQRTQPANNKRYGSMSQGPTGKLRKRSNPMITTGPRQSDSMIMEGVIRGGDPDRYRLLRQYLSGDDVAGHSLGLRGTQHTNISGAPNPFSDPVGRAQYMRSQMTPPPTPPGIPTEPTPSERYGAPDPYSRRNEPMSATPPGGQFAQNYEHYLAPYIRAEGFEGAPYHPSPTPRVAPTNVAPPANRPPGVPNTVAPTGRPGGAPGIPTSPTPSERVPLPQHSPPDPLEQAMQEAQAFIDSLQRLPGTGPGRPQGPPVRSLNEIADQRQGAIQGYLTQGDQPVLAMGGQGQFVPTEMNKYGLMGPRGQYYNEQADGRAAARGHVDQSVQGFRDRFNDLNSPRGVPLQAMVPASPESFTTIHQSPDGRGFALQGGTGSIDDQRSRNTPEFEAQTQRHVDRLRRLRDPENPSPTAQRLSREEDFRERRRNAILGIQPESQASSGPQIQPPNDIQSENAMMLEAKISGVEGAEPEGNWDFNGISNYDDWNNAHMELQTQLMMNMNDPTQGITEDQFWRLMQRLEAARLRLGHKFKIPAPMTDHERELSRPDPTLGGIGSF